MQPHGYPTHVRQKYTVCSSVKQRPLVVASWNVRTLQDTGLGARRRIAFIACGVARCKIGIAAFSDASLLIHGFLLEVGNGYTFLWSGIHKDARRTIGGEFTAWIVLLWSTQESSSQWMSDS